MREVIPLENLLSVCEGSVYKLAILAAKRAIILADGEKPMLERPREKVLDNALQEIEEGKVKMK